MSKSDTDGTLVDVLDGHVNPKEAEGLTAAEIAAAYKATLKDFVHGKTNRKAVTEIGKLLGGALAARKQLLAEREGSPNSSRIQGSYFNN